MRCSQTPKLRQSGRRYASASWKSFSKNEKLQPRESAQPWGMVSSLLCILTAQWNPSSGHSVWPAATFRQHHLPCCGLCDTGWAWGSSLECLTAVQTVKLLNTLQHYWGCQPPCTSGTWCCVHGDCARLLVCMHGCTWHRAVLGQWPAPARGKPWSSLHTERWIFCSFSSVPPYYGLGITLCF
jgi:hypothetical protein